MTFPPDTVDPTVERVIGRLERMAAAAREESGLSFGTVMHSAWCIRERVLHEAIAAVREETK